MAKHTTKEDALIREMQALQKKLGHAPTRREWRENGSSGWEKNWPSYTAFAVAALEGVKTAPKSASASLDVDREKLRLKREQLAEKVKLLTEQNLDLEERLGSIVALNSRTPQEVSISPSLASGASESAAVVVASDWHIEEPVLPAQVNNLNEYSLTIATQRSMRFFRGALRLVNILGRDTKVSTVVLALLGDFISGMIHDDLAEGNPMCPVDAIIKAEGLILSGLRFLLKELPKDVKIVIPCHSGNHARITKQQRGLTEAGNSLEYYMYHHLRGALSDEPRITWLIAEGYQSRVSLFDGAYTIRFHHGHALKYGGGIGGLTVPVLKAIAQWNAGGAAPDLDVFGHFHQYVNSESFVANGSLIGLNDYGIRIKASYQRPMQAFFLVNKKYRAKTLAAPIFV